MHIKKLCTVIFLLSVVVHLVYGCSYNDNTNIIDYGYGYYVDTDNDVAILDCGELICLKSSPVTNGELLLPTEFGNGMKINYVGESAFSNNNQLKILRIPDDYIGISYFSFMNCDNLETVYIGKNLSEIGDGAFESCDNIREFIVSSDNPHLYSVDGCVIKRENMCLIATNGNLPSEVKQLYHSIFRKSNKIGKMILPDGVEYIGGYAFEGSSLKSIVLTNALKTIEKGAFSNTKLEEIFIPSNVTEVGAAVFYDVDGIVINCEAESKPEGWDEDWLDGCTNYQLNWGVKRDENRNT